MSKNLVLSNQIKFKDTARFIDEMSTKESKEPLFVALAEMLKQYKYPERIIYNFLKQNTVYLEDGAGEPQTIVNPHRIFEENLANCVDCTLFISTVLKAMNIQHKYRLISNDPVTQTPEHIFVKTPKYTIDVIKGRSKEDPYNMSDEFNNEYESLIKYDYNPKTNYAFTH